MEERKLCKHCNRIYTVNELCLNCSLVDPDKLYPSKISAVYIECGIHQRLATIAFNNLAFEIESKPELLTQITNELGATEDEVHSALEDLYTEN